MSEGLIEESSFIVKLISIDILKVPMSDSKLPSTGFYDAFISYGRADSKTFAVKLKERLQSQNLEVWLDLEEIPFGVNFQNQINDGITKADNFLFLISPHSVNSAYCRKEIDLAIELNKRIYPIWHVAEIDQETWQERNPGKSEAEWLRYKETGQHSTVPGKNPNMHPKIGEINWLPGEKDKQRDGEKRDDFEERLFTLLDTELINIVRRHQDYVRQHTVLLNQALYWKDQQKQTRYLLIGEERQKAEKWLKERKERFKEKKLAPGEPTLLHCEFICESIKNADNLMTQVFLSHSDVDRDFMTKIREKLVREGITVWTNKTDIPIGAEFEQVINQGIEQADNVVYLISTDALTSHYCQKEIDYALSLNKRIIPLKIKPTDPAQIPERISELQFIDFTENQTEADEQKHLDDLLKVLQEEEIYYKDHKMLLTKALKWEEQKRNPCILLRGYNLRHAKDWLYRAEQKKQHQATSLQTEFINESSRQPPAPSLDVFISYSRSDSDLARLLNDELQIRGGKTTWFDQESIASGADFQQEINQGIESADNFLFIISPRSINSPYCKDEVEYAAKLKKRVITVLYQGVNTADLHPELGKVQWIDFTQGEFAANVTELLRTLETDREYLKNHTKWLLRAIAWDEQGQDKDLLLRGSELAIAQDWLKQANQGKNQPQELQIKFIESSRKNSDAHAKSEKRQRLIGLIVAAGSLLFFAFIIWAIKFGAENRERQFVTNSANDGRLALAKADNGQTFDALILAIKAGKTLAKHKTNDSVWTQADSIVTKALSKSFFSVKEYNRLVTHNLRVMDVSFSPEGNILAAVSDDNTSKLLDVTTDKELAKVPGQFRGVRSISFSPDGKILASSDENTIKLWNVITGMPFRTLTGHRNWVNSISFSPNGKLLASGSDDKTISLWDMETGDLIDTQHGDNGGVLSVSFSPDGKTLVSGSRGSTIEFWYVTTTGLKHNTYYITQPGPVSSISFSQDRKTLASGSNDDNNIIIAGVHTIPYSYYILLNTNPVTSVSFSPDGKTLVSTSKYKIHLWHLMANKKSSRSETRDSLIEKGCQWLKDYLQNPNSDVDPKDRHLCDDMIRS